MKIERLNESLRPVALIFRYEGYGRTPHGWKNRVIQGNSVEDVLRKWFNNVMLGSLNDDIDISSMNADELFQVLDNVNGGGDHFVQTVTDYNTKEVLYDAGASKYDYFEEQVVEETLTEASENLWDKLVKAYPELEENHIVTDEVITEETNPWDALVNAHPDLNEPLTPEEKEYIASKAKTSTTPAVTTQQPKNNADKDPWEKLSDTYPELSESAVEESFDDDGNREHCDKCGTPLNDGGTCPKCDDGEEDYGDISSTDESWVEYDDEYDFDDEDDIVTQDRMHAALYGGDREYCDKCGSKLVRDEWGGTCPRCNADELEEIRINNMYHDYSEDELRSMGAFDNLNDNDLEEDFDGCSSYIAKETSYEIAHKIAVMATKELDLNEYDAEMLEHDINNLRSNEWVDTFSKLSDNSKVKKLFFTYCVKCEESLDESVDNSNYRGSSQLTALANNIDKELKKQGIECDIRLTKDAYTWVSCKDANVNIPEVVSKAAELYDMSVAPEMTKEDNGLYGFMFKPKETLAQESLDEAKKFAGKSTNVGTMTRDEALKQAQEMMEQIKENNQECAGLLYGLVDKETGEEFFTPECVTHADAEKLAKVLDFVYILWNRSANSPELD